MTNQTTAIHICLAGDNNYAKYMGMAIFSILTGAAPEDRLVFHILDNNIKPQSRAEIESLKTLKDFTINCLPVNPDTFKHCHFDPKTISVTTYARFLIPNLIKEDKVIYLDCDIFVRKSLAPLYGIDITNYYMAGVTDYGIKPQYLKRKFKDAIPPTFYLNAGVLLINNHMWRTYNIGDELFKYAGDNSEHLQFADQDCLNYLLSKKFKTINPAWNVMDLAYDPKRYLGKINEKELLSACRDPFIRHSKPWRKNSFTEGRQEYLALMAKSPWARYMPKDDKRWIALLKLSARYLWRHPLCFLQPVFYLRCAKRGFLRTVSN